MTPARKLAFAGRAIVRGMSAPAFKKLEPEITHSHPRVIEPRRPHLTLYRCETLDPMSVSTAVLRDLEQARAIEWLQTDGLGGFAMGTAAGMNTRRYHGWCV